jgi:hypothetical protein
MTATLPERQRHWGDGADAKNKAIKELDEATTEVANTASAFIEEYGLDIRFMFKRFVKNHGGDGGNYAQAEEELNDLLAAIKDRKAKGEAFLCAMQPKRVSSST